MLYLKYRLSCWLQPAIDNLLRLKCAVELSMFPGSSSKISCLKLCLSQTNQKQLVLVPVFSLLYRSFLESVVRSVVRTEQFVWDWIAQLAGSARGNRSFLATCLNLELGRSSVFWRVDLKDWISCWLVQGCRPKKYKLLSEGMSVFYEPPVY